jgi:hypothetical protein
MSTDSISTNVKFCFAFFGKGVCEGFSHDEKSCPYSHSVEDYMKERGLKKCPKCNLFCKNTSKICSKCVTEWLANQSKPLQERRSDVPLKECPQGCGNMCKETSKACSLCVTKWLAGREQHNKCVGNNMS